MRWFLSIDRADLPPGTTIAHRSMTVDGHEVEFADGFADLHTKVYDETLAGRGFRIADGRPSIEFRPRIRQTPVDAGVADLHPIGVAGASR